MKATRKSVFDYPEVTENTIQDDLEKLEHRLSVARTRQTVTINPEPEESLNFSEPAKFSEPAISQQDRKKSLAAAPQRKSLAERQSAAPQRKSLMERQSAAPQRRSFAERQLTSIPLSHTQSAAKGGSKRRSQSAPSGKRASVEPSRADSPQNKLRFSDDDDNYFAQSPRESEPSTSRPTTAGGSTHRSMASSKGSSRPSSVPARPKPNNPRQSLVSMGSFRDEMEVMEKHGLKMPRHTRVGAAFASTAGRKTFISASSAPDLKNFLPKPVDWTTRKKTVIPKYGVPNYNVPEINRMIAPLPDILMEIKSEEEKKRSEIRSRIRASVADTKASVAAKPKKAALPLVVKRWVPSFPPIHFKGSLKCAYNALQHPGDFYGSGNSFIHEMRAKMIDFIDDISQQQEPVMWEDAPELDASLLSIKALWASIPNDFSWRTKRSYDQRFVIHPELESLEEHLPPEHNIKKIIDERRAREEALARMEQRNMVINMELSPGSGNGGSYPGWSPAGLKNSQSAPSLRQSLHPSPRPSPNASPRPPESLHDVQDHGELKGSKTPGMHTISAAARFKTKARKTVQEKNGELQEHSETHKKNGELQDSKTQGMNTISAAARFTIKIGNSAATKDSETPKKHGEIQDSKTQASPRPQGMRSVSAAARFKTKTRKTVKPAQDDTLSQTSSSQASLKDSPHVLSAENRRKRREKRKTQLLEKERERLELESQRESQMALTAG